MKSQIACCAVAFVLWPVLAVLAVVPVAAIVYAQLNCQVRRCVEVRYQAKDPDKGDTRNIYCVRKEVKDGKHYGIAYSWVRAVENCYGQNSKGGEATQEEEGHIWSVLCTPDCDFVPEDSLCSGYVTKYLSSVVELRFPTKCTETDPDPNSQPDPGP
ncbi:MAG: hypothetical protein KatS3mg109_0744 [Pirellulaceae bacterium]|nr:MAG: hypothetical protein KatS3mg109_0744 [Pirellulaceae bacterium]